MSEVLKHPDDETLLSDYVRSRRTDRLDEWSMDALANDITRLESKVKELEALNESLQVMPELTNELAQIGEIARQEADTYNMITAFKVGYEAIRKAVEGK